ncbi:SLC13 family permease [Pelagibacterium luteolum]|uniref:Solute carrier family 13 (Sodium-dependent dicarboxylate transporter), member 2/3/5 n=1 Tax=Pelagibacterium luteolum TaxID=440168 RepID=A0A1G7U3B3_9HYPH|nr:DASS family sodium-coupled anion symporter [Pelagibacterium luteolum]SDG41260.1 solute carrier family 13 (sodium-dependent dicarboxylate transporter), member 2/3/5 [Pelagibacterium luteolum]
MTQSDTSDSDRFPMRPIPIVIGLIVFIALVALPAPEGLSIEGWRVVAVAALMIIWWITEALPIPATSLLPIALFPVLQATTQGAATAPYGDPIIFLFMGGFILALAMERSGLHRRIALNILLRTGSQQHRIVGGFMIATAFLSMWVSNTATAVMMLPVAISVAELIKDKGGSSKFPLALMLSVAYAASIGGVGTLIGTPPNALLAGALNQAYGYDIGFGQWMVIGVPVMLVMLVAAWLVLTRFSIRLDTTEIEGAQDLFRQQVDGLGAWSQAEIRVGIVFVITAFAWMFRTVLDDFVPGLTDTSIAIMAAMVLFLCPSGDKEGGALVDWYDARKLPWDVLILFGGGLSLAAAVTATGLDVWIGGLIGAYAGALPLIVLVAVVSLIILSLTEFTSNTATAAAFIPLLAALAVSVGENPLLLTVPAALAASMAFMLPVATPPNALVFGSGYVTIPQMARNGVWLNVAALVAIVGIAYWLMIAFFGVTLGEVPDWAQGAAQ